MLFNFTLRQHLLAELRSRSADPDRAAFVREILEAKEKVGDVRAQGVDICFFFLDLLVEAKIRAVQTPTYTLVWHYQAESREFEKMEPVFQAIATSLMQTQEFVQRTIEAYIGHWLWDPIIQWVLMAPAWAVLGIIGGWLLYVGRRRRAQPVYA